MAQPNRNAGAEHDSGGELTQCNLNVYRTFCSGSRLPVICGNHKDLAQRANVAAQSSRFNKIHSVGEMRCNASARVEFDADGSKVGILTSATGGK